MADPVFRPARSEDMMPAYRMFRRSIFAYLHRVGLATAEEAADPPIDSAWLRQSDWIHHFWNTAAENWVATDSSGKVIGWALSLERSGHLELCIFFVDPDSAARGVGSRLLELAFTSRPETQRTIMATQDPSALALYLRSGISFQTTAFDICIQSRDIPASGDLDFRPIRPEAEDIAVIARIEHDVIRLHREADLRFLIGNRPGWIAWRAGKPVGYVFGAQPLPEGATDFPPTVGPAAALDDADIPLLLDQAIRTAPVGKDLYFGIPLFNRRAIAHLLAQGGKVDPFYVSVLSTEDGMQLDRYIHTSPAFII